MCSEIKINSSNIKHLEFFDNRIGEEGLKAIGDLLSRYDKLIYLSIA
jgi:hypothetical protein